jgi:carboxypeptidase Taq
MADAFARLRARMEELRDLSGVIGLLSWDQETYLPPSAHGPRGSQLSTLQGIYHERLVDPEVGQLLEDVSATRLVPDEGAMVRVFRRERDRAVKVPPALVRALAEAQSQGVSAWRAARTNNDFATFRPALEQLLRLRREQADAIGHGGERYDALLEAYEPGMTVERLTPVLQKLRDDLVPVVGKLTALEPPPDMLAGRTFEVEQQWRLTLQLLEAMGFDLQAGRQDRSIHPFTASTHPLDVRLTTRLDAHNLPASIFSTIHEGGHGLYEQGFAPQHHRTPLAAAPSMGLHESQSRLWENVIGRGRPFWEHWFPRLQAHFPQALEGCDVDGFHRSINRVSRSYIRVESDEVTYNLHVVLRYELELLLIHDELPVEDLPAAWNERMERYLGVRPPDDLKGVLQDIHWAWGELGYFPTYSLGNLYAAQLHQAMRRDLPDLEQSLRAGDLLPVRDWLRSRIHAEGYRQDAEHLVKQVTGQGLSDAPFMDYLRQKYASLYGVSL